MKRINGLILIVVLVVWLVGCGKSESKTGLWNIQDGGGSQQVQAMSWNAEYHSLPKQYMMALAANDSVYGCYVEDERIILESIDQGTCSVTETFVLAETDNMLAMGMTADQECNVYVMGSRDSDPGIWKLNAYGELQDFTLLELEDTARVLNFALKGIFTDSDGYVYIWCEMIVPGTWEDGKYVEDLWHLVDRVYVKDSKLETSFYEEIEDMSGTQVLSFGIDKEEGACFIVKDAEGIYTQGLDSARKALEEEIRLEAFSSADAANMDNITFIDNGFLYTVGHELYEYHFSTGQAERVFSLSDYGISPSDVLFLCQLDEAYGFIDNDGTSGYSEYICVSYGETVKTVITLGITMSGTVQDLENAVVEFNRYSNQYQIEIIDYYLQEESYSEALEQLKLDLVTGAAPDLISISGIDYRMLSEKNVLTDLYELMEEDDELSGEMFVASVLAAYEDGGHLYNMAPAFQLYSMWGYTDVIGSQNGVTFEKLFQLLKAAGADLNSIAGFYADETVLTTLCSVSMDEFVDWENMTCSFDGDYFKEVLSFAKEYTGNYAGGTYSERIQNREILMSIGVIASVEDYQIQKELYGGSVSFIGYPVAEGSGTAIGFRGSAVAINAKSEDQSGAWEFVKYYLQNGYNGQGFPVLQAQFDQKMEEALEEEYTVSEDGSIEKTWKAFYSDSDEEYIFVYAATKEDVDAVRELAKSAETRFEYHTEILNVINEEAEGYFSGQMDLDWTAEKIQNRVSLILEEEK